MSAVSKEIKKTVDIIAGKRRLTVMQQYVRQHYKSPDSILRGIETSYSPNDVIGHLRLIVSHIKSLCTSDGKLLGRYYSMARSNEMLGILTQLADYFEPITASSADTVKRAAFLAVPPALESLKNILGPYTDIKLASELQSMARVIEGYQDRINELKSAEDEVFSMEKSVRTMHSKTAKHSDEVESLIKDVKGLKAQLESQKDAVKELYERSRAMSRNVDRQQEEFEKRYADMASSGGRIEELRIKLEESYTTVIAKEQEFSQSSESMRESQLRLQTLIAQARHVLNFSSGLGLLHTYRTLYEQARAKIRLVPWLIGVFAGFIGSVLLISLGYVAIRSAESLTAFFSDPYVILQVALTPFMIFVFFFCLAGYRRQRNLIERYKVRAVAVESFLKISEKLPIESPEHARAAATIMRHIEQDFGPVAHSVFDHDLEGSYRTVM